MATPEFRDTARRVLARQVRPSPRAERARAIRRHLTELRTELTALAANPRSASTRIEEIRGRIARAYIGEPGGDQETLFEMHSDGPGAEMIRMMNDLGVLTREPQRSVRDVARFIAAVDRALAAPRGDSKLVLTATSLPPAEAR